MANINRVVLVRNLTKDPRAAHTPSGTAVCKPAPRREHAAEGRTARPVEWGDKPNYLRTSNRLGESGREVAPH